MVDHETIRSRITIRGFIKELYRRSPLLFWLGVLQAILAVAAGVGMLFDARTVTGINPWIKPGKFAVSIALFVWTLGWILVYVPGPKWLLSLVRGGVSVAMLTEIVCIFLQAARGVESHFNNTSAFNSAVFGVMGMMIVLNTACVAIVLVLFFVRRIDLPDPYLWGIRFGLAIFVLASLEGYLMVSGNAHTVGAPDGGPGLPGIDWSTKAGDLRIAHFIGLHALQVLPFVGYILCLTTKGWIGTAQIVVTSIGYLLICVGALVIALRGQPLIPL